MTLRFLLITLLCISLASTAQETRRPTRESGQLLSITRNYWHDFLELNPLYATQRGVDLYDDRLEISIGKPYRDASSRLCTRYLDSLKTIDRVKLDEHDALIADVLEYLLNRSIDGLKLGINGSGNSERPVDQFVFSFPTSFATMASGTGSIPFRTVKNYDDFIRRMNAFGKWVDVAIRNMNEGIRHGNTTPKAAMLKVPAQLQPLFSGTAANSIFYKPVSAMPDGFSIKDRERITKEYADAIRNYIQPAYKRLNDYIVNVYIPKCRTSSGLLDNAGGQKEYAYWVNFWTSAPTDPDSIFSFGLSEVSRIRHEMDSIRMLTGFTGDLKQFFAFVKTDKRFFPFHTEQEVLDRFRSYEALMKPALAKVFHLMPKAGFEVRATEKFRQAGANAQYMRPSPDGTRPGIFYEVIPDALTYNDNGMETLFLHEAIPGHHFQIALQQEMDLPDFMKNAFFGAFAEGWGLYAETLGNDLGMYRDPYQYLGRLNADMERSVRLVVDVGLHHKGWSRERAIAYVLDNQPLTEAVAEQRIERYMVIPGQALSYKAGEQEILHLRKLAQEKLGSAFDIREFHDQVLKDGAMPLSILDAKIRRWIDSKLLPSIKQVP